MISGVPYKASNYNALQKNSWRYVKKNINAGTDKVESILYKGLMGELKGKALEKEIAESYRFISYKSEMLSVTELRKAYIRGIEYTLDHSPYKTYKWYTSRRENVCSICKPLHGKEFHINNQVAPKPVFDTHPNCNCSIKIIKK